MRQWRQSLTFILTTLIYYYCYLLSAVTSVVKTNAEMSRFRISCHSKHTYTNFQPVWPWSTNSQTDRQTEDTTMHRMVKRMPILLCDLEAYAHLTSSLDCCSFFSLVTLCCSVFFLPLCLGLRWIQMNKMFRACDWSGAWAERAENLVSGSWAESGCHKSRLERWAENRPLTLRSHALEFNDAV